MWGVSSFFPQYPHCSQIEIRKSYITAELYIIPEARLPNYGHDSTVLRSFSFTFCFALAPDKLIKSPMAASEFFHRCEGVPWSFQLHVYHCGGRLRGIWASGYVCRARGRHVCGNRGGICWSGINNTKYNIPENRKYALTTARS